MPKQSVSPSTVGASATAVPVSPISLLVRAFGEAMALSVRGPSMAEEAVRVEALLIVANVTHRALVQAADLRHDLECAGGAANDQVQFGSGEDDYLDWLDAANMLQIRLFRLKDESYDSHRSDEFESNLNVVLNWIEEIRMREKAERLAMKADRLLALAARLEASRSPSDDVGGGR